MEQNRLSEMQELAKRLEYPAIDLDLLHLALCHSSYANEQEECVFLLSPALFEWTLGKGPG